MRCWNQPCLRLMELSVLGFIYYYLFICLLFIIN